jgi:dienelactone hydrolase
MRANIFLTVAALLAIGIGLWRLLAATAGLDVVSQRLGDVPVTIFRPADGGTAPVVVIAHGFAGSQQLMQPFAITLARNGYIAVTFDFPGHGRNATPLAGGLRDFAAADRALLATLGSVVDFARTLAGSDGRIALLGHSMASDVVVRYARSHRGVAATIAVSLFPSEVTTDSPADLLVIDGALEPAMLTDAGLDIVRRAAGDAAAHEGVTYGDFAKGSARRLALAAGAEHIGVLYSERSLREATAWLNQAFGRRGSGFVDACGKWLGLLFLGLVALGRPLARCLPGAVPTPLGSGLGWSRLLAVAIVPALLTPLILWKVPTDFMPILLGDYLTAHFFVYGALTALGLWTAGGFGGVPRPTPWRRVAIAAVMVAAYEIGIIGWSIDRFVTSFMPTPQRLPLMLAVLCGTLPYFLADEWLTRGERPIGGAYALTKVCFALSLVAAVALSPERLFFLVIIVPVIVIFFVVFGLFSGWAYRRTHHPIAGALAHAATFAWAIAVTFPVVSAQLAAAGAPAPAQIGQMGKEGGEQRRGDPGPAGADERLAHRHHETSARQKHGEGLSPREAPPGPPVIDRERQTFPDRQRQDDIDDMAAGEQIVHAGLGEGASRRRPSGAGLGGDLLAVGTEGLQIGDHVVDIRLVFEPWKRHFRARHQRTGVLEIYF